MPELGALKPYNLPALTFQPLNPASFFDRTVPEITPDTKKLADATATAAMMGAISDTFSKIPQQVEQGFTNYRKNELWGDYNDAIQKAAQGDKAAAAVLSSFTVTPENITRKPTNPVLDQMKLDEQQADIDLKKAHAKYYTDKLDPNALEPNPLSAAFGTTGMAAPKAKPSSGGALSAYGAEPSIPATDAPGAGDYVDWIKGMEGFNPSAYGDYKQTSIGYGTRANPGETSISQEQADARLRAELAQHEQNVDSAAADFGYQLTPAQREALISFDYNTGSATDVLSAAGGDIGKVKEAMKNYIHVTEKGQKVVSQGLINRRAKEIARMDAGSDELDANTAINATGGTVLNVPGHAGGTVTRFPSFDREELPDGTVNIYPHLVKAGQLKVTTFKKPAKYSAGTMKLVTESGYTPQPGETEAQVAQKAREMMTEKEMVPPAYATPYLRWSTSLQSNPVVKEFYTARHQRSVVDAALSKGLTPAAALGTIDAYVKAMRGGAATQGMTKILEEAQPLVQQLKLKWQKLTGGSEENAVLTPEMAADVQHILGRIEEAARHEVEEMREGDKEHWSTFGVPSGAIDKTYKRILGGRKSSVDMMAEYAPAAGTPAASTQGDGTANNPHVIDSQEAYDALPPGAYYRDSSGKLKRKKTTQAVQPQTQNGTLVG